MIKGLGRLARNATKAPSPADAVSLTELPTDSALTFLPPAPPRVRLSHRTTETQPRGRPARIAAIFWLGLICFALSPANAQELIVNNALAGTQISQKEARLIFTMRLRQWSASNHTIKVFVLPDDSPLHGDFAKSVLGLFPYQLRRVWDRQLFSGTGQTPTTVSNEQEMLRRVASTPGAVGYAAKQPANPRVHVVEVR